MPNFSLNPDAEPAALTRRPLGRRLAWLDHSFHSRLAQQ
jgi:hypothetical protein